MVRTPKVFQASLSDHFIIGVCWKLNNNFIKQSEHIFLSFSKINEEKFYMELCISRSKLFNVVLEANSVDNKLEAFNDHLNYFNKQNIQNYCKKSKETYPTIMVF